MNALMRTIKRLFSITLVCLFVVITAFSFVIFNVEQSIFDPALYIQTFEKQGVYNRFPKLAVNMLYMEIQEADPEDPLALLSGFTEGELETFFGELFPPELLKPLVEDFLIQFLSYLDGDIDQVAVSLLSLKTHLQSPSGIETIYGILKTQPDCTLEQVVAMAAGYQEMQLCNPPETLLFLDLRTIFETEIAAIMEIIVPDQLEIIAPNSNSLQEVNDLKNFRMIIRLSPIIPMLCLLLITIMNIRSLNDWLNWWGYPLWIAGLLSIGLTIISGMISALVLENFVIPTLPPNISPDFIDLFESVVVTVAYDSVQPMAGVAAIITFLGMIMVITAYLTLKKSRDTAR